MSGSLSAIANPSDQFWVSPAIGLVLAHGSVTVAKYLVGGHRAMCSRVTGCMTGGTQVRETARARPGDGAWRQNPGDVSLDRPKVVPMYSRWTGSGG